MTRCVYNSTNNQSQISRTINTTSSVNQPFLHPQNAPKSAFLEKSILMEIIEISATKYHILNLKCTKFDFGWSRLQTPLGELTALPETPYLDLRGLLLRGGGEKGGEGNGECAQFCIQIWGTEARDRENVLNC